jgi:hypothetical protein
MKNIKYNTFGTIPKSNSKNCTGTSTKRGKILQQVILVPNEQFFCYIMARTSCIQ